MTTSDIAGARFELAHMAHAELYTPDIEAGCGSSPSCWACARPHAPGARRT
ncbi:hypothetical protein QRX50_37500 [Amycolatopsis carbonis]|uniref:Uncharacterized protein n=1 Tax=Amycolatopsis carbonis TaxID=715471 RepID=A0A9Y2IAX7_9PSEU|nr:hypothetical protein [Amycolatopsis sp. 2-15]WIX77060.1 hypothetical protein QRX50_37500 [Amycolatopsis sp. 2-15]